MACHVIGNVLGPAGFVETNSGIICDCYTLGDVQCSGGPAGGLVGNNEGTIRRCYASGNVQSSRNDAGGGVGTNSGLISHCFAAGDVTAENGAGGLVGANSGEVSYCYATGSVTSLSEDEDENFAAALVARNEGTITYCYATGAGGMALVDDNSNEAIVERCFALSLRYGGGEDNCLCILLSDVQMRRQESFIGWDFLGTTADGTLDEWMMPADGGYPVLTMTQASQSVGNGTGRRSLSYRDISPVHGGPPCTRGALQIDG